MWKKRLCLGTFSEKNLPVDKQIELFGKVGFEAFFTGWNEAAPIPEWKKKADETGMIYQSIHAPFGRMSDMWENDSSRADKALEELMKCLADCKKYEVPIMVVHAIIGFDKHSPNELGVERFGRLIKEAQGSGVKIAFENTEGKEYLDILLKSFADVKEVGFCWDSGHEMCYNFSRDLLDEYGEKLVCTHLNDNLGIRDYDGNITWHDDLHLLPYDGIADWKYNVSRLKKCGYDDILTFELCNYSKPDRHENDAYSRMDFTDYVTEAYMRACRVASEFLRA